jgi:hypothetical protein
MANGVRHPVFARVFHRLSRPGNGIDFDHYTAILDKVVAVEPELYPVRAPATDEPRSPQP